MGEKNPSGLNEGHQIDFDNAKDNAEKRRVIKAQIANTQTAINLKQSMLDRFPNLEAKLSPEINALEAQKMQLEQDLAKYQD